MLKQKIRHGDPTLGLFVRTPALQVIETLGNCGLDFLALDAEHAVFSLSDLDRCMLAARSVDIPVLVRLVEATPAAVLQVLDMGAAGIIVPHVGSANAARAAINACRYQGGARGFSGQHRAAGYGSTSMKEYCEASDESIIVIAQIEDADGNANVAQIAAVDELDAIFIGRADLSISLGCMSIDDDTVVAATENILAVSRANNMSCGIFIPSPDSLDSFRDQGANLFIIGTDQSLLVNAASSIVADFRESTENPA